MCITSLEDTNVQSVFILYSGHLIREEQPDFMLYQLSNYFGENSNNDNSKWNV